MAGYSKSLTLVAASSQQANINDNASLSGTGSLSVAARVKLTSLPVNNGDRMAIASKAEATNASTDWCFELVKSGGTYYWNMHVRSQSGASSTETYGGAVTPSTGVWYDVIGTFNSATPVCKAYVNGTVLTDNFTTAAVTTRADNNTPTHIGDRGTGVWLDGKLSDVYLWDRVITGTEITNYTSTPCTFAPGANLAAHWSLDNVYTDDSGNGNTLTSAGSPAFGSDAPFTCASAAVFGTCRILTGVGS
jgi:hypothetical protein